MRKDRSIEEVRAKDRERQARWRANNKVLSRERRAYVYGKSKWPQMVEERMKPETRERYGVAERPPVIDHVTTPPEKAEDWGEAEPKEELTYDTDPEDARTDKEKSEHRKAVERLIELRARQKAGLLGGGRRGKKVVRQEGGRGVEIRLEVE